MDQQSLKQILSSSNTYGGTTKYVEAVQQQNLDIIKICGTVVISILQDQQGPHMSKFYTLRFINELLDLQEQNWIDITQKKILPILEEYALFNKESQDDERGKHLFTQNISSKKKYEQIKELEYIGCIFFRYTLESIWVWSKWFSIDKVVGKLSLFKIAQERLSLSKVKFPQITYFNKGQIINHMQIQRPPKEMLEECRLIIKEHLEEGTNTEIQNFQNLLNKVYFTEKNHQLKSVQTYSQVWKNAVELMKQGKMGQDVQIKLRTAHLSIMQRKLFQSSINLKKSKVALQQQVSNFSAVLNEKEKLLTELNNHILEKDLLQNQIIQLKKQQQEMLKENEELRIELSQIKLKQESNENKQGSTLVSNIFNEQLYRTKDLERQLQKKDIEIKRLSEQVQHYKDTIKQMNDNFDNLQQQQDQTEAERFKLNQQNNQLNIKQGEFQNQIGLLKQQNAKLNEMIKQLQTSNRQQYEEHLQKLEKQSIYNQQLKQVQIFEQQIEANYPTKEQFYNKKVEYRPQNNVEGNLTIYKSNQQLEDAQEQELQSNINQTSSYFQNQHIQQQNQMMRGFQQKK